MALPRVESWRSCAMATPRSWTLRVFALALASAAAAAPAQLPVQQLLPSPIHPDTGFGWFADIEGDSAAVFQRGNYWGPTPATYSYRRAEGAWELEQRVQASYTAWNTDIGPLALSRGWLAVCVDYNTSGTNKIGGVHLYERTESGWKLRQLLSDYSLGWLQMMGESLSLDGRRLAVGTLGGYAYIYRLAKFVSWSWMLEAKLPAPSEAMHGFGRSVALDGSTLVVGATAADYFKPGSAYVYELGEAGWQLLQRL